MIEHIFFTASIVAGVLIAWAIIEYVKYRVRKRRKKLQPVLLSTSTKNIMVNDWEQLCATGDPSWLIINPEQRDRKINPETMQEAYFSLYDDYSKHTGLAEKMEKWVSLMQHRLDARVLLMEGDAAQENLIDYYTAMIDNLMKTPDEGAVDFVKHRISVSIINNSPIDPHKTTLYEFLKATEIAEEKVRAYNNLKTSKNEQPD